VETKALVEQLNAAVPGVVLEARPFSNEGLVSIWVDSALLAPLFLSLRSNRLLEVEGLENLSAFQLERSLILTYFFRRSGAKAALIIRASLELETPEQTLKVASATREFPEAQPFEQELRDLFGVDSGVGGFPLLMEDWEGFPLRKDYLYPTEVLGVPHMRPVARTVPDEYEVSQ
jgi:Ni,Fe-hydrogenase III component G